MIAVLELDDVIGLHDQILETEPGILGYHGDNALGGALGRVQNLIDYVGVTDVFELAAMYIIAISKGHCFADGNKRTALVAALTFLSLNGIQLRRNDDLADMVEDVVKDELSHEDIIQILYWSWL